MKNQEIKVLATIELDDNDGRGELFFDDQSESLMCRRQSDGFIEEVLSASSEEEALMAIESSYGERRTSKPVWDLRYVEDCSQDSAATVSDQGGVSGTGGGAGVKPYSAPRVFDIETRTAKQVADMVAEMLSGVLAPAIARERANNIASAFTGLYVEA